jgi:hypothetical protein
MLIVMNTTNPQPPRIGSYTGSIIIVMGVCSFLSSCGDPTAKNQSPVVSGLAQTSSKFGASSGCVKPLDYDVAKSSSLGFELVKQFDFDGKIATSIVQHPVSEFLRGIEMLRYYACDARASGIITESKYNTLMTASIQLVQEHLGLQTNDSCTERDRDGRCRVCVFSNVTLTGGSQVGSQPFTCRGMADGQSIHASLSGTVNPAQGFSKDPCSSL